MIFLNEPETQAEVQGAAPPDSTPPARAEPPAPVTHRRQPASKLVLAGRVLMLAGVATIGFLGYEFGLSGLEHDRDQALLVSTFKQRIAATNLDLPTADIPEGSPVAVIYIPKIRVDQVVVEGTSPGDLKSGPGHLRDTPAPGEFGNAVIEGRRTTYGAPFAGLDQLVNGDLVTVTTGQGSFAYVVTQVRWFPGGTATPMTGTLDSRLTLVTSDPVLYPIGRLVVVAMLQGPPIAVPSRPPVAIGAAEVGLSGDPIGLVLAVIWAQVLAAAIWLATRLAGRLPRSVTLMFATPVILGLAVLAFSSLDLALPGTL